MVSKKETLGSAYTAGNMLLAFLIWCISLIPSFLAPRQGDLDKLRCTKPKTAAKPNTNESHIKQEL